MIKLYDYFKSSAAYRVRIALHFKQLQFESIRIHLLNQGGEQFFENYQSINPQSLVPSLQDGGKLLNQSLAIIEYLNDQHPMPPLLPQDAYEKSLVRAFALSIACDIHPLNNLRVLKYLTHELGLVDEKKNQWYTHWVMKGLQALEKQLIICNRSKDFCFGDTPSLADVCLVPQLYNARRFHCDLSSFTTLLHIEENCLKLSAFNQAKPLEMIT